MSRNLTSQLKYVVNTSFYGDELTGRKGGFKSSKHSDKRNNTKNGKIYSYNQKDNVESVAREFGVFMKEHYPNVRNVSDLNEKYATEFIIYKSNTVGTSTLNYYRSSLNTISECCNNTFKSCDISLSTQKIEGVSNEKVKTVSFTKEDLSVLKNSYVENSTGWKAISIIQAAGLRVSEVAQLKNSDIEIKDNTASVHVSCGKGGRERTVNVVKKEYVDTLEYIKNNNNETLFTCKSSSIDQNIHRHIQSSNLSQNYNYNSCHAIRKFYAQESYNNYRAEGYSIEESCAKVVSSLGHSENRVELVKVYIQNIH